MRFLYFTPDDDPEQVALEAEQARASALHSEHAIRVFQLLQIVFDHEDWDAVFDALPEEHQRAFTASGITREQLPVSLARVVHRETGREASVIAVGFYDDEEREVVFIPIAEVVEDPLRMISDYALKSPVARADA